MVYVNPLPPLDALQRFFTHEDGALRERTRRGRARAGDLAGTLRPDGRRRVYFRGKYYYTYRLIFKLQHGHDPAGEIDHEDRVPANSCSSNLREATRFQQLANMGLRCDSTSGFKGVGCRRNPLAKPWYATIKVRGRRYHLGYFATPEEAARAYDAAAIRYSGERACINFPEEHPEYPYPCARRLKLTEAAQCVAEDRQEAVPRSK